MKRFEVVLEPEETALQLLVAVWGNEEVYLLKYPEIGCFILLGCFMVLGIAFFMGSCIADGLFDFLFVVL
jgi:hypothetical protein